jgi:hypothetical protein
MQRKQAWITAAVVAVTFVAASLAVMANTGLLQLGDADHQVGRLTPGSVMVEAVGTPTTGASSAVGGPNVVIRYEDIYVTPPAPITSTAPTAAAAGAATDPADPVVSVARRATSATRRRTARTTRSTAAPRRTTRHEDDDHEEREDDD